MFASRSLSLLPAPLHTAVAATFWFMFRTPHLETLILFDLMSFHLRSPTHEWEVPCWLTMWNAATPIPTPVLVVEPIVFINIFINFGAGQFHAIQTETVEVREKLDAGFFNLVWITFMDASSTGTWCYLALKIDKARAKKYFSNGFLMLRFHWPDSGLRNAQYICEQGLFFARTFMVQKISNGTEDTSKKLGSQTTFSTIDRTNLEAILALICCYSTHK